MIRIVSGIALMLVAFQVFGAQPENFSSIPHFTYTEAALEQYLASREPATPGSRSHLRTETQYIFDDNGRYDQSHYSLFVIENEAEIEELSQLSVSYRPWYESRPVVRVRVFTSGQFYNLDLDKLIESSISQSGLSYSDIKILHIPLEHLQLGSVVELEIQRGQHSSSYEEGVAVLHPLRPAYPTDNLSVSVSIPKNDHFKIGLEGSELKGLRVTEESGEKLRTYHYRARHVLPGPVTINAHQPDVVYEPTLVISSGKNWQAIASSYARLVDARASEFDALDLKKIVPATPSRDSNILNAVRYMNKKIRYTANDLGQSTLHPDSPDVVIERQYGDCKDQATLLVAMLRQMDIPAQVALLSAQEQGRVVDGYPGISLFDHAIVYLADDDIWIDPTLPSEDFNRIPLADQGRLALIIDESTQQLVRTPTAPPGVNVHRRIVDIYYSDGSGAEVVDRRILSGDIYDVLSPIEKEKTEKIREQLDAMVISGFAGVPKNFEVADSPETSTVTMTVTSHDSKAYRISQHGGRPKLSSDTILQIIPIQLSTEFEQVRKQLLIANSANLDAFLTNEKEPVYIGSLLSSEVIERIHIPAYMEWITPPRHFELDGPVVNYRRTSSIVNGTLKVTTTATIKKHLLEAKEIESERENYRLFKSMMNPIARFEPISTGLLSKGKAKEAFAMHRRLIAESPDNMMQVVRYSDSLERVGLRQLAKTVVNQAMQSFPENAALQRELGNSWLDGFRGDGVDTRRAALHLRKAIELEPDDIDTLYRLARAELEDQSGFTDDREYYQSLANFMESSMERYRTTMRTQPGIYSSASLTDYLYAIINYTAMSFLLADEPDNVKRFLSNWGMGDEESKSFYVSATAVLQGVDAALAAASTAGMGELEQLMRDAMINLMAIKRFDLVLALLDSDRLRNRRMFSSETQRTAQQGVGCLDSQSDIQKEVWAMTFGLPLEKLIRAASYPPIIAGITDQDYLDSLFQQTRGAFKSRVRIESMKCRVAFDVQEIGPLVLVNDKKLQLGLILYRYDNMLYHLTSPLNIESLSRLLQHLEDADQPREWQAVLDWYFQPAKRARSIGREGLKLFERREDIPSQERSFYAALLHSEAMVKNENIVKQLKNPPAQYSAKRYRRVLQRHIINALPKARHEEKLALLREQFEESDQLVQDWKPISDFYVERSDIAALQRHLDEYIEEFGDSSVHVVNAKLTLALAEGQYEKLIIDANAAISDKLLQPVHIRHLTWSLFKKNTHLPDALALLAPDKLSSATSGDSYLKGVLLAATGKPLLAYESLVKSKEERSVKAISHFDMLILALNAQYLGFDEYLAELVAEMKTNSSTELTGILERF